MDGRSRGVAGALGAVAMVWLGAPGCGSSDGGGGPIAVTELRDALVAAVCHMAALCGDFPDAATCATSEQEFPHFYASLPQLVAAGRVAYDGQKARRCVDQLNALTSCTLQSTRSPGALADCDAILTGQVSAGDPCFFDEECPAGGGCVVSGNGCDKFTQCCTATCLPAPSWVQAGGDCTGSPHAFCVDGTSCAPSPDGTTSTCQPFGATVGAPCASVACVGSLFCEPSTHTCQLPAAEGGACTPSPDDRSCDDRRDHCDSTGHCTPRLPVRAACQLADDACVRWARCSPTTLTCAPLPAAGESCQQNPTPFPCLGGLTCDPGTSTCTRQPAGGSCL